MKLKQVHGNVSASQMHAKRSMKAMEEAATVTSLAPMTSRKRSTAATETYSETQLVTSTPTALSIVQHSVQEVQRSPTPPPRVQSPPVQTQPLSQPQEESHENMRLARKQRLEARTRELFNQLTLPLDGTAAGGQSASSSSQGNISGVGPFMTLPCKLKVNIKIAPKEATSKTKNNINDNSISNNDNGAPSDNECDDEVVVAEIEEIDTTAISEHASSSATLLPPKADPDTA